ncbi:MAG: DNA mismatch repair protein MutS [Bacillota bacterium]
MARDKNKYTPMMQQYLKIKEDYNDAIVFFRLGDFYEMFFEDALIASKELEIQLTARDGGGEKVPMCGVPHHSSETYISRLVDKGYKVAICEQTELPEKGKKLVNRDVIRLVTPGTNIDEYGIESYHIASVGLSEHFYTISYLNVSTGEMGALKTPKDSGALINELSTIPIKEIVISHAFDRSYIEGYAEHEGITLSIHRNTEIHETFEHLLEDLPTHEEKKTTRRLLSYIMETQKRTLLHLKKVEHIEASSYLRMDAGTIRHLELTRTMIKNKENGSLFWLLNKTKTAMGARFLKRQILRPSVNKDTLETRYDFIGQLNTEFLIKEELSELLKNVYDLERIVGRVSYGNTNAKDLVQLRGSLKILPDFKDALERLGLEYSQYLAHSIDPLKTLHDTLEKALVDDPPITIKEGGMIEKGYDEALDELKAIHLNVNDWLKDLEESEREKTGIKKLKVGYNRVFGYYIEVPKGQIKHIKDDFGYTRKQTLANAERYITESLKEKEKVILSSEEKSIQREYELFSELRDTVREVIPAIQLNAAIISEVDMFLSLSSVSEKLALSRPTLHEGRHIAIKDGWHPVVEAFLDDPFIPNDTIMDERTDILLITGPNMSGKSTYMRQLAITAIMAQIGSFVPAKSADLPVFDQLFTRIGASDDLISGKSTFMVEMLDANHAIKNATDRSLILFDEIGRGTSTYDGMAIAQAIIEYIHEKIGAKTLFSTHYHELTDLEERLTRLRNVHVAAKEEGDTIRFHHKVKDGKADRSYGINVASLAKLPPTLIRRSKTILSALEKGETPKTQPTLFTIEEPADEPHPHQPVIDALERINPDEMKPIDALTKLYELKEALKNRQ